MKETILKIVANYPFVFSFILFFIGALVVLTKSNLFKKLLGINIMESAIFLIFVASANIKGGKAPVGEVVEGVNYVNPLPSALMLTGIVVSVSVTAFALALILRLYKEYGTSDANEIARLRDEGDK